MDNPFLPGESKESYQRLPGDPSNKSSEPSDTRYSRIEPEPGPVQLAAKFIYDKFYNPWPEGQQHKRHGSRFKLPLDYFFYATMRWGFAEGISRYWEFRLAPHNWVEWARRQHRRWQLVDRREKKMNHSYTLYAVDRDGDLFLVECPQCHATQHLYFQRKDRPYIGDMPPGWFDCRPCSIYFKVYLEDGLRTVWDHRQGVPPLPSTLVMDDNHQYHLGISKDAPWWWPRKEIMRDLHNGKDAHGHKPYIIKPRVNQHSEIGCSQQQEAPPETPNTGN